MIVTRKPNGIVVAQEEGEIFDINEWLDELYDTHDIEVEAEKSTVYFEAFMKDGEVILPIENKQEEIIAVPKVEKQIDTTSLDLKASIIEETEIAEEFTFEEELESTQTIGEVVTDFLNKGWLIEKTRVQRGYATYETIIHFKSNGNYSISKKRIAGPEIKYLESIIKEMRIGETGANGLPVIQKFIDEKKDLIVLTVISEEHLIIKYKLRQRSWFKQQQQLAVMCSDF